MLLIWLKADKQILQAIRDFPEYVLANGKMFIEGEVVINDLSKVEYKYIQDIKMPQFEDRATTIDDIVAVEIVNPVIPKRDFKLSQLYGLTQAQLETYIDANVTTLAIARTYLKKLSAVVLYLVKQTKLDS